MSRTPLPWRYELDPRGRHLILPLDESNVALAETFGQYMNLSARKQLAYPADSNAEFIVRAVNNHEALVEAAKSVLAAFDDSHYGGITDPHRSSALNALVRAVENAERG